MGGVFSPVVTRRASLVVPARSARPVVRPKTRERRRRDEGAKRRDVARERARGVRGSKVRARARRRAKGTRVTCAMCARGSINQSWIGSSGGCDRCPRATSVRGLTGDDARRRNASYPDALVVGFPPPFEDVRTLHDAWESMTRRFAAAPCLGARRYDAGTKTCGAYEFSTFEDVGRERVRLWGVCGARDRARGVWDCIRSTRRGWRSRRRRRDGRDVGAAVRHAGAGCGGVHRESRGVDVRGVF